jgi:hypothetical protein
MAHKFHAAGTNAKGMFQLSRAFPPSVSPSQKEKIKVPLGHSEAEAIG